MNDFNSCQTSKQSLLSRPTNSGTKEARRQIKGLLRCLSCTIYSLKVVRFWCKVIYMWCTLAHYSHNGQETGANSEPTLYASLDCVDLAPIFAQPLVRIQPLFTQIPYCMYPAIIHTNHILYILVIIHTNPIPYVPSHYTHKPHTTNYPAIIYTNPILYAPSHYSHKPHTVYPSHYSHKPHTVRTQPLYTQTTYY